MEIKSKIWIELDGEPVFSKGRWLLLNAIKQYGSINRAARELGISYRRAWSYIKAMEERLNKSLVVRRVGGKDGGGASLTPQAMELLKKYERLEKGIEKLLDKRFEKIFGK